MAALIGHGLGAVKSFKTFLPLQTTVRHRKRKSQKPIVVSRIEATAQSIGAKGFLRNVKAYRPGDNVVSCLEKICEKHFIPAVDETKLEEPVLRFNLFTACEKELGHSLPNSKLSYIDTIADLKEFYLTPVDTATPLDALNRLDLPKNLSVTSNYHRFHPDTDTMFGGKTAFPKSSTIVTGLRYKKKYLGHKQDDPYRQ